MQKEHLYGVIGLLAGALIMIFLSSYAVNNNLTGMMGMMGFRAPTQTGINSNTIDAHFIEQMIPHHEDAITMAKLAPEKAQRAEIKQLAQNIIDSQGREINQMKDWYKNWFGREVPTGSQVMTQHGMMGNASGMHMGMMGDGSDLTRLKNAENFDKAFIEEMIPHHQMAVMMATMLKNATNREEMKRLADDIITSQSNEINQMRDWQRQWGY